MARTLVWVDERFAKELEMIDDVAKINEEDIKKFIGWLKSDIENMKECLDDDVVAFRNHAAQVRTAYQKVVEEEIQKTGELWEKMEYLRAETKEKLDKTRELTQSTKRDLEEIQDMLSKIRIYGVDDLLKLVERIGYMNEVDKGILYGVLQARMVK